MTLPAPRGEGPEAVAELERWLRLAREGEPPEPEDACDAAEFAALLGRGLPPALRQWLSGASDPVFPAGQDEDSPDDRAERPLRAPTPPRPEIRRAPDLRSTTANRDKRA